MEPETVNKVLSILSKGSTRDSRAIQYVFLRWANPDLPNQEVCVKAGFSPRSAKTQATKLRKNPSIVKALAVLEKDMADDCHVDRAWWMGRQKSVVDRSMTVEPVLDHEGKPTGEYEFDSSGANRGLDNIAKAEGFYKPQTLNIMPVRFIQHLDGGE